MMTTFVWFLVVAFLLINLVSLNFGLRRTIMMNTYEDRKLATIRRISKINSIPGADKIVCSEIDGWSAVVQKGQFEEG